MWRENDRDGFFLPRAPTPSNRYVLLRFQRQNFVLISSLPCAGHGVLDLIILIMTTEEKKREGKGRGEEKKRKEKGIGEEKRREAGRSNKRQYI